MPLFKKRETEETQKLATVFEINIFSGSGWSFNKCRLTID